MSDNMSDKSVTCAITGKRYTYGKDYFKKRVEAYGDVETLKANFIVHKALTYLNRGYTVEETRNFLGVEDTSNLLPGDHPDIQAIIQFHKIKSKGSIRRHNFATHKSDKDVSEFINNIRDYEEA